jgi:hypothetical protein
MYFADIEAALIINPDEDFNFIVVYQQKLFNFSKPFLAVVWQSYSPKHNSFALNF